MERHSQFFQGVQAELCEVMEPGFQGLATTSGEASSKGYVMAPCKQCNSRTLTLRGLHLTSGCTSIDLDVRLRPCCLRPRTDLS